MAGTFNGNPLTMAASRATLTEVLVGDVYDGFNRVDEAMKAGLRDVIRPGRNRAELDDVPADVRDDLSFHPVMTLGEVLELALDPAPSGRAIAA